MSVFQILGLGTALPEHFISQTEAAEFAGTCLAGGGGTEQRSGTLVHALYRRSGVQTRHSVLLSSSTGDQPAEQNFYWPSHTPEDTGPGTALRMARFERDAPQLALTAAQRAIRNAAIQPQAIRHLVTVSCSGFSAPRVDLYLMKELGLPATVSRTHVGFMGCHGALNGLRVARALAAEDPDSVVLMCAVELCTLHHQYGWDPQEIVANSLFGDGAGAIVGRSADSPHASASNQAFPGCVVDHYSSVIPNSESMMSWRVGDTGFRMTLSPEVPDVISRTLPGALHDFLGRHGLTIADVGAWAIHPGGPRILQACGDVAGLSAEQLASSVSILSRCGNMSSPTVLFILEDLQKRGARLPCVMLGFGPGLNVEVALLR